MIHRLEFVCRLAGLPRPVSVEVYINGICKEIKQGQGTITIALQAEEQDSIKAIIYPEVSGFWAYIVENVNAVNEVDLPPIETYGPLGWWHLVHGIQVADAQRGSGLRIGVIDESLYPETSLSHIICVGRISKSKIIFNDHDGHTHHGMAVCGLLAAKVNQAAGFEGIVPGAEVLFLSARSEENSAKLSPQSVAAGILWLAHQRCDIICVSAGDGVYPKENIRSAVQDAFDMGCLCIFAAGNNPGSLKYPAKYEEVIAVTSLGKMGIAPEGSLAYYQEMHKAAYKFNNIYVWNQCPSGDGVDCIAAGVGLIINMDGQPHNDVYGTSFSCPIAAGVLAATLQKDEDYLKLEGEARARHARYKLQSICAPVFPRKFAGAGVPIYSEAAARNFWCSPSVGNQANGGERTRL